MDRRAPDLKPKDLVGIPWMAAFALRADGWWLRSPIIWDKPNPTPESVGDTGVVALRASRSFVGIEISPEFTEMARRRILEDAPLLNREAESLLA